MKRNEYSIYNNKIRGDKNIAICSDIHINSKTPDKKLQEVLDNLEDIKPTHIVIPGDLYDPDEETIHSYRVKKFIDNMTEIAKVYYIAGDAEGHLLPAGIRNNLNSKFRILCEKLYFDEQFLEDRDVTVAGLRLPNQFYRLNEEEKLNTLLFKYREYLEKLSKDCGDNNLNILLCHDPVIVRAMMHFSYVYAEHFNFDLVISGHNHGGNFPKLLKLFRNILATDIDFNSLYTKGVHEIDYDKYAMISEGITKYDQSLLPFESLEHFHEGTIENVKVYK